MTSTELTSPTMDAEPTLAADLANAETQDCYAWSQADDADDTDEEAEDVWTDEQDRRYAWGTVRIFAGFMTIAATAAIIASAFLAWPQNAENLQVAPTPVPAQPTVKANPHPQPQTPDQRFLTLLQQRGNRVVIPAMALQAAHAVCSAEAKGYTDPEIADALIRSTPGMDMKTAAIFVDTAHEVYCMSATS